MKSATRVRLQPALVLHRYPYRDSSLLIEVMTRDYGRYGLVARGARGNPARQRTPLEPFQPLLVSWSGRGDLGTLTNRESNGTAFALGGVGLFPAWYLNELLLRLLPRQDPHPRLFDCYVQTLEALAGGGGERSLRLFEKRLLEELGYGLQLDAVADSDKTVREDRQYEVHLERGPVEVESRRPGGLCFTGRSLLSLHREELADTASLRDAKRLMRAVLALYLGDRPLKTREVLRGMSVSRRGQISKEVLIDS